MSTHIDTRHPEAVEEHVRLTFCSLFPGSDHAFVARDFAWARQCFTGQFADYQPIDARYHDFEHTLQGTLCLTRLLRGHHSSQAKPELTQHSFELALLAILFHDTGYLKKRGDTDGTGAKYTLTHVARSTDFAREFLSAKGLPPRDIDAILNMIRCTGVSADLNEIPFHDALERKLGYALATADLLGQMAAPDYVEKLPVLFQEFAEAADHEGSAAGRLAMFQSAEELARNTPSFWANYVLPKIRKDFESLYLFLCEPYPHGPNSYLQAIQDNLDRIGRMEGLRS